ncbi:MAG: IgA Peptidase M64 [Candidatus Aminicenantes bacterium]|nr:IgA Peptidase M64 [Candidatus Aminicenantes bacterium]
MRPKQLLLLIALTPLIVCAQPDIRYSDYFVDKTMRIDYFHIGDAREELVTIDQISQQGIWAGSQVHLLDEFNNGRYFVKIFDLDSGKLIYSKGFDSYFGEYKTTDKAAEGEKRTYHESAIIPYPKRQIRFSLEARDRDNRLYSIFSQNINPTSISILKDKLSQDVKVFEVQKTGDPHKKVDIAFIGEGYTSGEEGKFKADLDRLKDVFFNQEPYKTFRDKFNIYGVLKASQESGSDEPRFGVYKNTAVSTTFNALGSERYLLTEDNKSVRDIAAHVPYDALFIMVNHKRYGGGGIYNFYCTFTVDNQWYKYLFLHEFGHSFSGLADEYYTSSVAYNEFYPRGVEPLESNITALTDPQNVKWRDILTAGIEMPTPWEKEEFDKMDNAYQKVRQELNEKIAALKRNNAPKEDVDKAEEEAESLSLQHAIKMDDYLAKSQFAGTVGAFEGAGYSAQGLYRPMLDCLMFSKGDKPFCKVCEQTVIKVIKFYTE